MLSGRTETKSSVTSGIGVFSFGYKGNWCIFIEKQTAVEVAMPRVGEVDPSKNVFLRGPIHPRRKEDFDESYQTTPAWQIGYPQPVFQSLANSGTLRGRVLDVGCGTGEHAQMAAAMGLDATGIDLAQAAIAAAQASAQSRGLNAQFHVWDALQLPSLGQQFDTVLDCGIDLRLRPGPNRCRPGFRPRGYNPYLPTGRMRDHRTRLRSSRLRRRGRAQRHRTDGAEC